MRNALALVVLLALAPALHGCKACSRSNREPAAAPEAPAPAAAEEAAPRPGRTNGEHVTGMAVAVRMDDRVYLWVDGRTSAIGRDPATVRWTPHGFEYAVNGGAVVLGPGGAPYWKPVPSPDAKPLVPLLEQAAAEGAEAPEGWRVESDVSRSGRVRVVLHGPDGRQVRVGTGRAAPSAVVWLTAEVSRFGRASPALGGDVPWRRAADGTPESALPEGAVAAGAEPDAKRLADWRIDLSKKRRGEVEIRWAREVDLDRDGAPDGVICVEGGRDEHSCYAVREVGGERRYQGIGITWTPERPPLVFEWNGAPYVMSTAPGRRGRSPLLRVVRYDGASFLTEPVR